MTPVTAIQDLYTRGKLHYHSHLRLQLLAGFVRILMGMILVGWLAISFIVYQMGNSFWRERQRDTAIHASHEVNGFLAQQLSTLGLLETLGKDEMRADPQLLQTYLETHPPLKEIVFLNSAGKVLAHAPLDNQALANSRDLSHEAWFKEAQTGRKYYGVFQASPGGNLYLTMALPTVSGGVVAAQLDLTFLWDVISETQFGSSGLAYVVDSQGQLIAHPDRNLVLQGMNISGLPGLGNLLANPGQVYYRASRGLAGVPVIGAKEQVGETGWWVITEMTAAEFSRTSQVLGLLLFAGGAILFILITRLVSQLLDRLVLQPMSRLQVGTQQVGQGRLDYRVNLQRTDELGQVAETFDQMTAGLGQRQRQLAAQAEALNLLNEKLEARVEERTAQLSQANVDLRREVAERETAEKALRASEAKFRELFENVMDGVFQSTPQGEIITANPAMVRMLGFNSLEELQRVDIPRDLYVDPLVRDNIVERLEAEGTHQKNEIQLKRKDGRVITVLENVHGVMNNQGEVQYFEGTLTDITDQKESEVLLEEWSKALQRKTHQQERLIATAQELNAYLDPHILLRRICEGANEILEAYGCVIYLLEEDGHTLNPVVAIDPVFEQEVLSAKLDIETSLNGQAIRARRGLIFNNPLQSSQTFQIPGTSVDETERVIVAPLIIDGQVLGTMCLDRMDADFTEEELALAETFAAYASTALKNAQAHDSLQREIEERKRVESALRESEERYMLAIQGANDGLWDWNLVANSIYYSPRWKAMLGCGEEEVQDFPDEWFNRVHPADLSQVKLALSKHLQGLTPHFESEHRMLHSDGSYRWVLARGLAVCSPKGVTGSLGFSATRLAGSLSDITARKTAEEQLLHDAFHDALTGLPNRALFMDRLGRAIERTHRHPESPFAVLFLDLDRFKVINDSLGHTVGDELLRGIASRLGFCLRTADTAARLGGDEFVVLLEDVKEVVDAEQVAERIRADLKLPFLLGGHEVVISTSIGIVFGNSTPNGSIYERTEEVMRDADIALYKAKELGKDRVLVFNPTLRMLAIDRLELENELRAALEHDEFQLHYQPIHCLTTERITGFEALLRWNSPLRGVVPPGKFIQVAEETGLIVPIGEWVLRTACNQLRQWQDEFPLVPPLTMNVNISGVQFAQPLLPLQVKNALNESGLDPRTLRLEITESVFMENAENASLVLEYLRQMGVQLHIDDFGTGYSSLAYLQRFPVSMIKIDRSFVERIGKQGESTINGTGSEIIKSIVTLARDLGMEAVAEGVETQEQLDQLKALECPFGQGFFIARPLTSAAAHELLEKLCGRPANTSLGLQMEYVEKT